MTYDPIRAVNRVRPPRPPARTAEDLELEKQPPGDAFAQIMWRQALARAIRQARSEAQSRHDPVLKEKLRMLYRTLWGGRRLPAHPEDEPPSKEPGAEHPKEQRKPHD
jgi:hypothetical protein